MCVIMHRSKSVYWYSDYKDRRIDVDYNRLKSLRYIGTGLVLGLRPANERRRYFDVVTKPYVHFIIKYSKKKHEKATWGSCLNWN